MTSSFSNELSWLPLRHRLKRALPSVWGTLVVDLIINVFANLTTVTTDTPLSKFLIIYLAVTFPIPVFTCLGFLVLLTIFSLTGGYDDLLTPSLDQQNRVRM